MDLLALLRQRTHAHHARLDARLDFGRQGITLDRYVAFLTGVRAVVTPLEAALVPWLGQTDGPSRSACVGADLAMLGVHGAVAAVKVRSPNSVAEAYGCAYVLEGSALGGRVLALELEKQLGASIPASYLRLRGADTARAWRAWLERLQAFGASSTPGDARAACAIACATFDAYATSLRASGAIEESFACRQ